jgi:hypothetical protein
MKPGGRGVILRSGRGVRLVLSQSRQLVASTCYPEKVAGQLNTLVGQQRR